MDPRCPGEEYGADSGCGEPSYSLVGSRTSTDV